MSRREPERFKPYEQEQGQLLPSFVADGLDPSDSGQRMESVQQRPQLQVQGRCGIAGARNHEGFDVVFLADGQRATTVQCETP